MTRAGGRRRADDTGHGHGHDLSSADLASANPRSPLLGVALTTVVGLVAVAAIVSMVMLWPDDANAAVQEGYHDDRVRTQLTALEQCSQGPECLMGTAEVDGEEEQVRLPVGPGSPSFSVGDEILVNESGGDVEPAQYSFLDFDRTTPLIWLTVLFVAAVLLLSRWKGLISLIGLGLSLLAVTMFVVPALIAGKDPLLVALTAAALIMIVTIYTSQGVNIRSSIALVGTLISLTVAGGIGAVFTAASNFTGFSDDSMKFLVTLLGDIDISGLLLAGLIIGALGVLDDVTVTQTAAVWEIAAADPTATRRQVFASAMRIGRAHVSATVNTLVLAYVGASLPLIMLMSAVDASAQDQLLSEGIAQEVVRGLAGSLGIIAAVPVTTALAASVVAVNVRPREHTREPVAQS